VNKENEKINFNSALGAKILDDQDLAQWFFELCIGRVPQVEISQEILREMEISDFIVKADTGFKLGANGEEFARKLGIIREKAPIDLVNDLLKYFDGTTQKSSKNEGK